METTASKEEIRRELKLRRCSLKREEKHRYDSELSKNIAEVVEFKSAGSILFFFPVKGEPNILPLLQQCLSKGREVLLPAVEGEELIPKRVESLTALNKGKFGIPEPMDGDPVDPSSIELILVPGLAFDTECFRLGWGKGYYDRLLKRAGGFSLGIAYSFQVLHRLPRDSWDIPVNAVVTEKELIRR